MTTHSGIFTLARDVSVVAVAEALRTDGCGERDATVRVLAAPRLRARRELLDSFDWRLFAAGLMLEWQCDARESRLRLWTRGALGAPLEVAAQHRPRVLDDLPVAALRRRLARVLGVRALLVQGTQAATLERLDLFDARDKVVARVELWRVPRARTLLARVVAVRGFEAAARAAARRLGTLAVAADDAADPIWSAARRSPVPPGGYPSWRVSGLDAAMRADDGVQRVLRHYARIMTLNIDGARAHLDPEFLHDFRIGLRRSRALLRLLPGVFASARLRPQLAFLAWLGRETTITRDADVHALVFPGYAAALCDPALTEALAPVWARVRQERRDAHARLTALFASARFKRRWAAWTRFLEQPAPRTSRQPHGPMALRAVGTHALHAAARRVRRRGRRIAFDAPAQAYHNLRKDCKRLRYLIDTFESVMDVDGLARATRRLKALQEVLGEHQDLDVHRAALQRLYEATARDGAAGAGSAAAMHRLLAELDARSAAARARFACEFEAFLAVRLDRVLREAPP